MAYTPERGDLVWLNFTPQQGNEQRGVRPAVVISPMKYNKKTGLAICCPITSTAKGYPFEVKITGKKISGVILSDHIKSLDWKIRKAKFIEKVSAKSFNECIAKLSVLIISQSL
jgi:mRNA interferase MazF